MDDVEYVLNDPIEKTTSGSSGRRLYKGFTPDGRLVAVVFEQIDSVTAQPVTAFPIDED